MFFLCFVNPFPDHGHKHYFVLIDRQAGSVIIAGAPLGLDVMDVRVGLVVVPPRDCFEGVEVSTVMVDPRWYYNALL